MTTPHRHELIEALVELHQRYPAWRFGQLVANVAGWADRDLWDVEDEELVAAARLHLNQLEPLEAVSA